ncbi:MULTISPECIES: type II toxin-antitoxin system RelE/ParE family toxin [Pseudomonas syringae group]|uniref:Plasmid stabilization system n=2 Tax=Pseudomonas syringae group TaxID=136849 RepID=A0A0N8QZN4_PSECA|nr:MULTISPECIES: type II toxin-antitoxin system RelE/ParE family toxin [Pseudomonas syringae group]RMT84999.1 hypothetical protein ALP41_200159 [Pseudomonas savastanoi pv. nerii]KAA8698853.1 type II toxin-antitoxin system RelE/ParE family toxin [Pseudomonas cannabina]KPW76155.1 hypothetical protein ALO78_200426 [Pseudomonas amygdali pv. ciccaronei]KPW78878.1 hypothetical protein ALO81_200244 [Pseudomonas cannabina]MBN3470871.1 type II toxin-antitoxin system RelE/ParE family toxin [Pseudomonas 
MPQLIWSPSALRDIQRLYRFLALNNPEAARRAVKTIREDIRIIAEQPEVGRLADRMATEYREWLIDFGDSGYVILYRYDTNEIVVVAVRHQKEVGY